MAACGWPSGAAWRWRSRKCCTRHARGGGAAAGGLARLCSTQTPGVRLPQGAVHPRMHLQMRAPRTPPQGHDTNPAEVFSEAEKLASLRHPCVMAFYGIVTSPDAYATVSEYICHGSLRGGLMKVKKKVRRTRGQRWHMRHCGAGRAHSPCPLRQAGTWRADSLPATPPRASATSGCARTSRCRRRRAWSTSTSTTWSTLTSRWAATRSPHA